MSDPSATCPEGLGTPGTGGHLCRDGDLGEEAQDAPDGPRSHGRSAALSLQTPTKPGHGDGTRVLNGK